MKSFVDNMDATAPDQSPMQAMRKALLSGEATALSLVYAARAAIARLDVDGPKLNAVLEMNPEAEGIAAALDAEMAGGTVRGPLHGIPILLKDNIDTGDMMHTSAGAFALRDRYAPRDAHIAARLRAQGAVILGKTNMTELANFMAKNMPNGFSSRGGQVVSPWGEKIDPSGSSTGSAVAVAAGYVPVAIGTETMGSIISPAATAGVVGIKPTVGLVSRRGIIPISISQDTAGPMGRSVQDCADVLDILCGPDAGDPFTLHGQPVGGYGHAVRTAPHTLETITLGLVRPREGGDPFTPAFLAAVEALRALGANVVEIDLPPYENRAMGTVLTHEFRQCMDFALLGSRGCPTTLESLAAFNRAHPEICLKYGQENIDKALAPGVGMGSAAYIQARAVIREKMTEGLSSLFAQKGLTAVVTPSTSYFPISGYPSVSIPVGSEQGEPMPLVLSGLAFSEKSLLRAARAVERKIGFGATAPGVAG